MPAPCIVLPEVTLRRIAVAKDPEAPMFRTVSLAVLVALSAVVPAGADTAVPESTGQIALSFAPVVKRIVPAVVTGRDAPALRRRLDALLKG